MFPFGKKLFQAFEQGGREITRQFGGLGLGLAITRSIIKAHGGLIQARSEGLGQGATFTLEVPLHAVKTSHKKTSPLLDGKTETISRKRILLVEDHTDTRASLGILLQKNNHEVKAAASAAEALKLAHENTFDLVISDIGLPDQSGI